MQTLETNQEEQAKPNGRLDKTENSLGQLTVRLDYSEEKINNLANNPIDIVFKMKNKMQKAAKKESQ
jgi:hypothetical protein